MNERDTGRQILTDLMGAPYLDQRDEQRNAFNAPLQDYSDEVCFGRVWGRDGIDKKLRSILNLAILTALNRPAQLKHHLQGALNNGCTPEEIQEILLHTAVYCGLPAAGEAFKVAEGVLRERGLIPVDSSEPTGPGARVDAS
ncbi:carboxymuconolactone decarboxylase family protein [Arthrobacter sp. FW306-04-A]|uniref:carboxymuconolactone decarboxylase family protein n=1 Tax=Arthrobacter sp. FW306-04-A TaxID=2879619 RepID=UPI0037C157B9|nr:carboxymuconolactone decarboxylase family protein [Arthrobacter sp. FW306-04-A]